MSDTKATGPLSGVFTRRLEQALAGGETFLGLQQKRGVDRQSLSRYLSGEQSLAVETVNKLLGYFKLEVRRQGRQPGRPRKGE